jgi:NAD+ kinase
MLTLPNQNNSSMDMFKQISLITNSDANEVADTLNTVIEFLQQRNIGIELDECCARIALHKDLPVVTADKVGANSDLAIAIGGDGTMLKAAHLVCGHGIPLLGINRGHLGFLADIPADSVQQHLDEILKGNYAEDERFLLYCEVHRGDDLIGVKYAFNDVIVQKWDVAKLIELDTYVDGTFVHRQRSDGMIVSSPTGSTAYALSGGGPILYPTLDALVLVPICPHSLTNRPIVINGNSRVEIVVSSDDVYHARLTCDGDIAMELESGDRVIVEKKNQTIRLIHPANHDHFSILRAKLRWG